MAFILNRPFALALIALASACEVEAPDGDADCVPGQYVARPGTPTNDPVCSPCPRGTFSDTPNALACNVHGVCSPGSFVSAPGTGTTDTRCAVM